MQVLLIRRDADGTSHWKEYFYDGWREDPLLQDIMAHLNTTGVSSIEIIPEAT